MASLDILCSKPLKIRNKITKKEHKKIFGDPSKSLKNILWPINICLIYFQKFMFAVFPFIKWCVGSFFGFVWKDTLSKSRINYTSEWLSKLICHNLHKF